MTPGARWYARIGRSFEKAAIVGALLGLAAAPNVVAQTVSAWQTRADRSQLMQPQAPLTFGPDVGAANVIDVNENLRYQTMDGFGASLTDSSAWLIQYRMSAAQRNTLLNNLFSTNGNGIGLSVLRQPMGGSDFSGNLGHYNYAASNCPNLSCFSIQAEMPHIIPILKQIKAINPNLLLWGVPWSPPGWMKNTGSMLGSSNGVESFLLGQHYPTLAQYFVKWIQAYQAQGLPIYAVLPQNEPQFAPGGYPGMKMSATDQASFIKNFLGPAFASAGLNTKIVAFDHNWDIASYPTTVLNDPAAKAYVAGAGFHCYGGNMSAQTTHHNAHPDRDIWHTECSDGAWIGGFAENFDRGMKEMVIGVVRHWAKGNTKWNLALDTNNGPTSGGCFNSTTGQGVCYGTVTIDQASGNVTYNAEYYFMGHASKFVQRGAHRIASNEVGGITNVAFRNPGGSKVLVAYNTNTTSTPFRVKWGTQSFAYTLPGRSAVTFTWASSGAPPLANGTYRIVNRFSSKALDVAGNGTANGTNVQQWTYGGGNNQRWTLTHLGSNQYQIQSVSASKALDVAGVGTTNGSNVHVWTYGGGGNQKWLITPTDGGYFRVSPVHAPSQTLDVAGPSTADGANVHTWEWLGTTSQQWTFQAP